jgi:KipI family sensor histidine kinase inhibitor
MNYEKPRYLDAGEAALSVEFGDSVDPKANARVLALDAALSKLAPEGVMECAPTYRSLMVHYEPLVLSRAALVQQIEELVRADAPVFTSNARWIVPCCYEAPLAEDIGEAARALGCSIDELAKRHAGTDYRAYMYGFAPGWCYLGGLPGELALPRRAAPRDATPRGAVLIGGGLALIAADPMPTGWYVVGCTPERVFSLQRERPFLIGPGDAVSFEPIDATTFASLDARAGAGEVVARRVALS